MRATWHLAFASEFLLVMIGGAIVIGLLASTRWLSPVAALIAGAPLLAAGLFTLLTPATAQGVIVHLVYGQLWQSATETLAASGWLVLFGGMLLAAVMMPGRWRRDAGRGSRSRSRWRLLSLKPPRSVQSVGSGEVTVRGRPQRGRNHSRIRGRPRRPEAGRAASRARRGGRQGGNQQWTDQA